MGFHWLCIGEVLGLHVGIISLYSDGIQAGLFTGIHSTLCVPYKQQARHAWREAVAAVRTHTDEAKLLIKLQLSSSAHHLSRCESHSVALALDASFGRQLERLH